MNGASPCRSRTRNPRTVADGANGLTRTSATVTFRCSAWESASSILDFAIGGTQKKPMTANATTRPTSHHRILRVRGAFAIARARAETEVAADFIVWSV